MPPRSKYRRLSIQRRSARILSSDESQAGGAIVTRPVGASQTATPPRSRGSAPAASRSRSRTIATSPSPTTPYGTSSARR